MIDGSVIRTHTCASGYHKDQQEKQALGRSKGGFSTKIHALVDALGLPIRFILTPANVIANKGRVPSSFIKQIQEQNCMPIISSQIHEGCFTSQALVRLLDFSPESGLSLFLF